MVVEGWMKRIDTKQTYISREKKSKYVFVKERKDKDLTYSFASYIDIE